MDYMKFESPDMVQGNIEKIEALFPNCVTETRDEDGKLKKAVNFDMLRQILSGEVAEGDEAYEFTWVGKKAAIVEANKPTRKTLRPCPEESVNWDTTENLYIEGDNLEVLKLLQESYLGKVKMIYIDPPYNTGHDFVYPDSFIMDNEEYDEGTGYFDEDGNVNYSRENSGTAGKYHSDWCSMIYSRLLLSRSLLSEDGVIFISINDYEVENLRNICNEVFGRSNLVAMFCWRTDGNFDNQAKVKICHEYILMYAKDEKKISAPPVIDPNIKANSKLNNEYIRNTIVKNGPKNPISDILIPEGFPCDIKDGIIDVSYINWPKYSSNIIIKNSKVSSSVIATSGWASKAQLIEYINNGFNAITDTKGQIVNFVISKTGAIECVKKRSEEQSHVISVLQNFGGTQKASVDLGELAPFFDYPKPVVLLKYLASMITKNDDLVLDYFSGSATTAQAVMQLNAEDEGKRRFIMVQLQEPYENGSTAFEAGFKTICDVGKARIRQSGQKIKSDFPLTTQNLDTGFRVLKLADSNMNNVYYSAGEYGQQKLDDMESKIKSDRTDLDLLFGCLLEWGLPLSLPYKSETIDGCTVHTYATGDPDLEIRDALIACFDEAVPTNVIEAIAHRNPLRAVFREECFTSSPDKINVYETFKRLAQGTAVKVI